MIRALTQFAAEKDVKRTVVAPVPDVEMFPGTLEDHLQDFKELLTAGTMFSSENFGPKRSLQSYRKQLRA